MPKLTPMILMLALVAGVVSACATSNPDQDAVAPPQACGVPPDCNDL